LIASTLQATTGTVEVTGRVAALLELGAGFDAEFTGRENVYVNASILGLSHAEIDACISDIAAFAEIGDFFDQPVKTYSSGMVVRLAFAVAAHVKPDILIVDEALSVGDARFQLKCARAIDRFIAEGVTLLFVSHELSLVKRLCRKAVLLDGGKILYAGHPNDVANLYSKLLADGSSAENIQDDIEALQAGGTITTEKKMSADRAETVGGIVSAVQPPHEISPSRKTAPRIELSTGQAAALFTDKQAQTLITGREFAYGGVSGQIKTIAAFDVAGHERSAFSSGETLVIRMIVEARDRFDEPIYALTLKNTAGVDIYGTNTLFGNQPAPAIHAGDTQQIDFTLPLNVPAGAYFLSFGFTQFVGDELVVIHRRYEALKIDVHSSERVIGLINLHASITARPL